MIISCKQDKANKLDWVISSEGGAVGYTTDGQNTSTAVCGCFTTKKVLDETEYSGLLDSSHDLLIEPAVF